MSLLMLALVPAQTVKADTIFWQGVVSSNGTQISSSVLESGREYTILVGGRWFYNYSANLAADAQYYTTDPTDPVTWLNNFPAPSGHSFLQINDKDVSWGPFSNGDTSGHTYTTSITGAGEAITFKIVDWMDLNTTNNVCHIDITIKDKGISIFNVTVDGIVYSIQISTNSSITGFSFSQVDRTISLNVTGAPETTGFMNMTFPTQLLTGPYIILMDGSPQSATVTSSETQTSVYITYSQSSHTVETVGTIAAPEFPTIIANILILTAMALILFTAKRNLTQHKAPNM
jgi:hypothetical protein